MSTAIDERVVQMRFDNKDFEKNVSTTINSLKSLDDNIKNIDHTTGLQTLSNATKGISLDGLINGVEAVKDKFSALSVIGITALMNITNQAVESGKKILNALTLEPIKTGFDEYQLKMGSIQTIMASTGESLETVNGYLNELNKYSDKTIYSFSDMTQNIGKFTNAGVKLEDAVAAIKGISNEAAISGANANEASRAMYNFAQALSAGYVKLIDWKSIENANMATVEFKNQLLDTALALGTVEKHGNRYISTTTDMAGKVSDAFDATHNFNDSLSAQWMTTDVLTQTLQNYSVDVREMTDAEKKAYEEKLRGMGYTEEQIKNIEALGQKAYDSAQDIKTFSQMLDTLKESAQSGWAESWELVFGNFEEAKNLWTAVGNEISNILQKQADERNNLLREWADNGGKAYFFEAIKTAWESIKDVIGQVKEAFETVFPPVTAERLKEISIGIAEFAEKLRPTDEQLQKIKTIFEGVFSAVDIFRQALAALSPYLSMFGTVVDGFLNVASAIAQFITKIDEAISRTGAFKNAMSNVFGVINSFSNTLFGFDIIKTKVDNVSTALKNSGIEWSKYNKVVKDSAEEEVKATQNSVDKQQAIRRNGAAANLKTTEESLEDQKKAYSKHLDQVQKDMEKAYERENKIKKKAYDQEYKDLQNALNNEYKARQKELDAGYNSLQKSLNEELEMVQEKNRKIQEDSQKAYEEDVKEFRKATNEKIALIDKEYKENLKLIDEERYNKLKEIDDEIAAINKQAEDEEKAREQAERDQKLSELTKALENAKSVMSREKAEKALAEFQEEIAKKELVEQRKNAIEKLKEQKEEINEEYDQKKEAAKEKRDLAVEEINEESSARLEQMAEAHDKEMEALRKSQEEEIEIMRESNSERLSILKESNSEELSAIRERNSERLSALKESQNDELSEIRDFQREQLSLNKENNKELLDNFKDNQKEELETFEEVAEQKIETIEKEKDALVDLSDISYALRKLDLSTAEGAMAAQKLLQDEYGLTTEDAKLAVDAVKELSDANENMAASITNTPISGVLDKIKTVLKEISTIAAPAMETGKNFIIGFRDGIVSSHGEVFDSIINFGRSVLDKVKEIFGIHSPSTEMFDIAYNCVQGFILGFVEAIPAAIKIIAEKFGELFAALKDKISEGRNDAERGIESFRDTDTSALDVFVNTVKEKLSGLTVVFDHVKKAFELLKIGIQKVGQKISEIFNNSFNSRAMRGNATRLFGTVVIVEILKSLKKGIIEVKLLFDGIKTVLSEFKGDITDAIRGALGEVKNTLVSYQKDLKANMLLKIAAAIAILAASMWILSTIDSEKIMGSINGMIALFGGLAAEMVSLGIAGKATKGQDQKAMMRFAENLTLLSAAVLVLSIAMQKIGEIDADKLKGSTEAIMALVGEMGGMAMLLSNTEGNTKSATKGLITLGVAVIALAAAVKILASVDPNRLWESIGAVGALLGALGVMGALAKNFKASNGAGMLETAAALLILVGVVAIFGHMKPDTIWQGIEAISALEVGLSVLGVAASKFKASNGLAILEVATALGILAGVVYIFGSMDPNKLKQGEIAVGILLVIIGFMSAMGTTFTASAGAGILLAASAMLLMSVAIAALGALPWYFVAQGIGALAGTIVLLAAGGVMLGPVIPFMFALAGVFSLVGVGMLAFGAGVSALAAGLAILSVSSIAGATSLVTSFDILLVGFIGAIADSIYAIKEVAKAWILSMCDVFAETAPEISESFLQVLLEILKQANNYGPQIADELFTFILMLLNKLSEYLPDIIDAGFELINKVITGIIENFKNMDPTMLVEAILAVGMIDTLLLTMAGFVILAAPASVGVLAASGVILELIALLTAIGGLAQIPGLEWLVTQGGQFLQSIGEAVGGFLGGIAGGIVSGVVGQLVQFGDELNAFIDPFTKFIDAVKTLDESAANAVSILVDTIFEITKGEIISNLTNWLTGGSSLTKFGEELEAFGPHIKAYSDSVKGIDSAAIEASASAANILSDMAKKLPNSGGLAAKIFGDNSLAEFGKELASFGPHIKQYGIDVKGLDTKAVETSASAATILSDMASKLPNAGGLAAKILGDNTLSQFGKELESFGPHIKKYGDTVKGLNVVAVTASTAAASILSGMASDLPNQGGMVSWFTGDNTLSKFGKELEKFGPHMMEYSKTISGMNIVAVTASSFAIQMLTDVINGIPNSGGVASWFTGDKAKGLEAFGDNLKTLGKGIKKYASLIEEINLPMIPASALAIDQLISIMLKMALVNEKGVENFANGVKALAKSGIDDFVNSFSNVDTRVLQAINNFVDTITKGFDMSKFKQVGSRAVTSVVEGMTQALPLAYPIIGTLTTQLLNHITANFNVNKFRSIGLEVITSLLEGLNMGMALALPRIMLIGRELTMGLKSSLDVRDLRTLGLEAIMSLLQGLDMGESLALPRMTLMGKQLTALFKASLDVNELKVIGLNLILNLLQGLDMGEILALPRMALVGKQLITFLKASLDAGSLKIIGLDLILYLLQGLELGTSMALQTMAITGKQLTSFFKASINASEFKIVGLDTMIYFVQGLEAGTSFALQGIHLLGMQLTAFIKASINAYEFRTIGLNVISNMLQGLEMGVALALPNLTILGVQLMSFLKASFDTRDLRTVGLDAIIYLIEGMQMGVTLALADLQIMGIQLTSFFKASFDAMEFRNLGLDTIIYLTEGMHMGTVLALADMQLIGMQIMSFLKASINVRDMREVGTKAMTSLITGMSTGYVLAAPIIVTICKGVTKIIQNGVDEKEFRKIGTSAINGLTEGVLITAPKTLLAVTSLTTAINKIMKNFTKEIGTEGHRSSAGFLEAFMDSITIHLLNTYINNFIKLIYTIIKTQEPLFNLEGRTIAVKFMEGILDNSNISIDAGKRLGLSVLDGLRDVEQRFMECGRRAVEGFARGINDDIGKAEDAGSRLGDAAYNAAKKALDEHSPSKKMSQVGSFAGEGFVNGLHSWVSKANTEGSKLGDELTAGIESSLTDFQNGTDFSPVITPVLDLDNLRNEANRIGGILDLSTPIALANDASISFSGGISRMFEDLEASIPENSNDDIVEAVNKLNTNMIDVMSRLGKLQVVLDTGTMVGELVNPLDEALGYNAVLNKRGVR